MQDTHARHTWQTHMQDTHGRHTCKTHMQDTHGRHTCKTHMADTHARHTCKTHMQDTHARHTCGCRLTPGKFLQAVCQLVMPYIGSAVQCSTIQCSYWQLCTHRQRPRRVPASVEGPVMALSVSLAWLGRCGLGCDLILTIGCAGFCSRRGTLGLLAILLAGRPLGGSLGGGLGLQRGRLGVLLSRQQLLHRILEGYALKMTRALYNRRSRVSSPEELSLTRNT